MKERRIHLGGDLGAGAFQGRPFPVWMECGVRKRRGRNMWKKWIVPFLRAAGLCSLCAGLTAGWYSMERSRASGEAAFIFVGTRNDADCCIMCSGSSGVLVDTGEAADAAHILQILEEKQVERIDCLILTHPDQDHVGGAFALLDALPVRQIITPYFTGEKAAYQDLMTKADTMRIPVLTLSRARQFHYGDLRLRVFPPEEFFYEKSNDYSLATLVEHGDVTLFLAGDAEEKRLEEVMRLPLPEDIRLYKTAHHGRPSPKGAELIEMLTPSYAVVTAREMGQTVKTAFDRAETRVYTAVGQDVVFISDGEILRPVSGGKEEWRRRTLGHGNKNSATLQEKGWIGR